MKKLLNIPDRFAVAAALPLGKHVHYAKKLTRKPVAEIATWDRSDGPPVWPRWTHDLRRQQSSSAMVLSQS